MHSSVAAKSSASDT